MDMRGQHHAPVTLGPEKCPGAQWIGDSGFKSWGWMICRREKLLPLLGSEHQIVKLIA